MQNQCRIALLACALWLPAAHGQELDTSAQWSARCADAGREFEVSFESRSGDITEDDMAVYLTTTRGTRHRLALPEALYHPRGAVSAVKDLCDVDGGATSPLAAFKVGASRVLLWLSQDNRPSFDRLSLALIDIDSGALLDARQTPYEIKTSENTSRFAIRRHGDGYQVRLVGEWLQGTQSDGAETAIEYWMQVRIKNQHIVFTPTTR